MKKLNDEKGQTFIVVTHDPRIADEASQSICLRDGLIQQMKENDSTRV
jgi:ABC-type lipoprotein export system ATPase subunit